MRRSNYVKAMLVKAQLRKYHQITRLSPDQLSIDRKKAAAENPSGVHAKYKRRLYGQGYAYCLHHPLII